MSWKIWPCHNKETPRNAHYTVVLVRKFFDWSSPMKKNKNGSILNTFKNFETLGLCQIREAPRFDLNACGSFYFVFLEAFDWSLALSPSDYVSFFILG